MEQETVRNLPARVDELRPIPGGPIWIVARAHPFSDMKEIRLARSGSSVSDLLAEEGLLPPAGCHSRLFINDSLVDPELWREISPHMGDLVVLRNIPATPATPAKIGALIAKITLKSILKAIVKGIITAVVSFVIGQIVKAIAPPPSPKLGALSGQDGKQSHAITGINNRANHWGPVPVLLGKAKIFPVYGAKPFTEVVGDDQYLRLLFDVAHGRVKMSELKIGQTPIDEFDDVEYEIREGVAGEDPITLYSQDVDEDTLDIKLDNEDGWVLQRTGINADEISIDVGFPSGLIGINIDNLRLEVCVDLDVEYQQVGTTTWLSANPAVSPASCTGSDPVASAWRIHNKTTFQFRRNLRWTVSQGQYDVRVRRLTPDRKEEAALPPGFSQIQDLVQWSALRTIRHSDPVTLPNIARIAMRIRATDQLNGVVDTFNLIGEAYQDVWNGSTFSPQLTREAAWAYLTVLRGPGNKRPVGDNRIDLAGIKAWNDDNVAAGGRPFNMVIDFRTTVFEMLSDIAAMGRASFGMKDGKFSVVQDKQQTIPVQHFTPRNSWDYSGDRSFADMPHALKVRFINIEGNYEEDEITVPDDGYGVTDNAGVRRDAFGNVTTDPEATKFDVLELLGAMLPSDAWKHARYHLAAARLRPETHEISCDVEHIVCTRGNLVRLVHDVPSLGLGQARIKLVNTSGPNATDIDIDDTFTMEAGKSYAARIRYQDGSSVLAPIATVVGDQTNVVFTTPIAPPIPKVGDLLLFGLLSSESAEMIVKEITPGKDLTATLRLVDHSPAIHSADIGVIPVFNPQITQPANPEQIIPPAQPIVEDVRSDETVLLRTLAGSLESNINITLTRKSSTAPLAADYQVRYRETGIEGRWRLMPAVPADAREINIFPVEDGRFYDIRIRAVSAGNVASPWTEINGYKVIGKSTKPPDVAAFFLEDGLLRWLYPNEPRDLEGFLIRRNPGINRNWDDGIKMHDDVLRGGPFPIDTLPIGLQTLMIKAVDTSKNQSKEAAVIIKDLGDPLVENILVTEDHRALGWPGTITNGQISGGDIIANQLTDLFWSSDGDPFWTSDPELFWHGSFWTQDNAPFWMNDAELFWNTLYAELTYEAPYTPDPADVPSILTWTYTVEGESYRVEYDPSPAPFWSQDPNTAFWSTDGALFWGAAQWLAFPGKLDLARQEYRFRIVIASSRVRGKFIDWMFTVDVPDIEEILDDVAIAAGGTRLPVTNTYRVFKNVLLTLQDDGGSAVLPKVMDKQLPGPLIKTLDSGGTGVTGSVDAHVQGY